MATTRKRTPEPHALELLPHNGLCLYDAERAVMDWALNRNDDATQAVVEVRQGEPITRGAVIAGAIQRLGELRYKRLEQIGQESHNGG